MAETETVSESSERTATGCHFYQLKSGSTDSIRRPGGLTNVGFMSEEQQAHRAKRPLVNRREVVARAEAFLDAHAADVVDLAQLCRATGVSERTLRNAFNDVHGMSPKRFMLHWRLRKAHHALTRGHQASVTAVATDFGFYELGRFASRYRAVYGRCPSETLRAHAA